MLNLGIFITSITCIFLTSKLYFGKTLPLFNIAALAYISLGLIAVFAVIFGIDKIKTILKSLKFILSEKSTLDLTSVIKDVVTYSKIHSEHPDKKEIFRSQDEFLTEAIAIHQQNLLGAESIGRLLKNKAEHIFNQRMNIVNMYRQLAKFPPALGIIATIFAVIAYITKLSSPLITITVAELIEVSLFSTLYGFLFSNLFLIPVAERLEHEATSENYKNLLLSNAFYLYSSGVSPEVLLEELNGHLGSEKRITWNNLEANGHSMVL